MNNNKTDEILELIKFIPDYDLRYILQNAIKRNFISEKVVLESCNVEYNKLYQKGYDEGYNECMDEHDLDD